MKLVGAGGQAAQHVMYDASGTIASATLPQLLLPHAHLGRSSLLIFNLSTTAAMFLEIGSARATATITNGVVTGVAVTNAGFGFSLAPTITFRGGGADQYPGFLGSGDPNSPPVAHAATAHCVMTGSAPNMSVASITIDNGGSGYLVAPYVAIRNRNFDANGCADPSVGSGSGVLIPALGRYEVNGTTCSTDPLALFCATLAAPFTCKWMD
jgi:hypothetical protein